MSKKKKKSVNSLNDLFLDNSKSDNKSVEDTGTSLSDGLPTEALKMSVIERRLQNRRIPKADEGFKDKEVNNPSRDAIENYYHANGIGKYVHMEQIDIDGKKVTTSRIQFEFGQMLKGYDTNTDERGMNPVIDRLSFAQMNKKSFINNIENTLRYINYFIEYFDDDDELMRAYFSIMFSIMLDDIDLDPQAFIESMYAAFTTDTMIEKLIAMIEYNVDDGLVKKTDRVYDESVQLTIEHLKAIMGISCLHKFAIPLVGHYYNTRQKKLEEAGMTDKDLYYYAFTSFIPVFDEHYDICLYNKIYHTSTTRITKTTNQESKMWDRRKRFGTSPVSYTNQLMKDFVIDISQKAIFSKSAIVFIHVCFDKAIKNELFQPDKYEFTDMKMESSDSVNETISRFDRWQTDKTFHSQRDRIRAHVSVKDAIDRMGKTVGINFKKMRSKKPEDIKKTEELRKEYEYYRDNIPQPFNDTQLYLIQLYYTSIVGSSDDSNTMEASDIFKLVMIMKRDFAARNYNYFRFFISSQIDMSTAKQYNRRRVEKLLTQHPLYQDWMDEYGDTYDLLNRDKLLNEIKTIIACPIKRVVDYEFVEKRDKKMMPNDICVVDEVVRFHYSL